MSSVKISQLTVYPVKSLRGIDVSSIELESTGPRFDRRWMVVNSNGKFLTQRVLPRMCLIETALHDGELSLSYGGSSIKIPRGGEICNQVTVWRDSLNAADCGDEAAAWLSEQLGKECRLVYCANGEERKSPEGSYNFTSLLGFADAYPLLLAAESSLAQINGYLSKPISMQRFRPNVVISGSDAFAEDQWKHIAIADQPFVLVSPCTRCVVPSIDPATGLKDQEVLDTLNQHRRVNNETLFGQNVVYQNRSTISVGDEVKVLS